MWSKDFIQTEDKERVQALIISVVTNYFTHFNQTNSDLLEFIREVAVRLIEKWYQQTGREQNPNYGIEDGSVKYEQVVPRSPQWKQEETDDEYDEQMTVVNLIRENDNCWWNGNELEKYIHFTSKSQFKKNWLNTRVKLQIEFITVRYLAVNVNAYNLN